MKTLAITFFCLVISAFGFSEKKAADKHRPFSFEGIEYVENGKGIREKWFIDLYETTLYLETASTNPESIINNDQPMLMSLRILSDRITPEKMVKAINEGFHHTKGYNAPPLKQQIEALGKALSSKLHKGDTIVFAYTKDKGLRVYKNERRLLTVAGLPFKQALFRIWLGPKPADKKLKQKLLGL